LLVSGEATGAHHAAGEIPGVGFDDVDAAFAKRLQVGLVAALPHMFTFMAEREDGRGGSENNVVRKSLARPFANFPQISGSGNDHERVDRCATEMCSTAESISASPLREPNRSVMTFSPLSAAKVSGR